MVSGSAQAGGGCVSLILACLFMSLFMNVGEWVVDNVSALLRGELGKPPVEMPSLVTIQRETEGLTDAQLDAYLDSLTGRQVVGWTGQVCDVSGYSRNYHIKVTVNKKNDWLFCTSEVSWQTRDNEEAASFAKGEDVVFTGIVAEARNREDFVLRDVNVE